MHKRFILSGLLVLLMSLQVLAKQTMHYEKLWDQIAKTHVYDGRIDGISTTLVDYEALLESTLFPKLVRFVGMVDPDQLNSEIEKKAFWINVYNIAAIKMVLDHYPVNSIRDISQLWSSVWDKPAIEVNGKTYSLGQIEHDILRKTGDHLIHWAIVCASLSCPQLRNEAYTASKLSAQLADQESIFLESKEKGLRVDDLNKVVWVSNIFKWFAKDFEKDGNIITFLKPRLKQDIEGYTIRYIDYSWKLNLYKK